VVDTMSGLQSEMNGARRKKLQEERGLFPK
jgi:hypothetical protein